MIPASAFPPARPSWLKNSLVIFTAFALLFGAPTHLALAAKPEKLPPPTILSESSPFSFHISQDGMYRVSYEELKAAGLDLLGVKAADIAVTYRGLPVPVFMSSERLFGPGAFFDFYAQALDTLYTDTNVYQIQVNHKLASRVKTVNAPPSGDAPTAYYMETLREDKNTAYNISSPISDPWYHSVFVTTTSPQTWSFPVTLADFLPGSAPVSLAVDLYGANDVYLTPDHHVQVSFNGLVVAEAFFDGLAAKTITAGGLTGSSEANSLEITLPGDTGASVDGVFLEGFSVSYPRALVAQQGSLHFSSAGPSYTVSGLSGSDIVGYRMIEGELFRLSGILVSGAGAAYTASFAGTADVAEYWVYDSAALPHPKIVPGRPLPDVQMGGVDYLMISHPDFIEGLEPLVLARQAQGYSVKVVNVEDLYDQYSYGVFDPQAIRSYIAFAKANLGTQYVLLVGGDTYDYKDYLGQGNKSYIPTLYAPVDRYSIYSPVDPLYADLDGDRVPDLAIGRFPVRDTAQLSAIIAKTLEFESIGYPNTSIFSSDVYFSTYSDAWAAALPDSWSTQFANLDQIPTADAKTLLVNQMNTGTALVNYFGHSSPVSWAASSLFTTSDVPNLDNSGKPFVVAQYGCWNSYFVDPRYDSLGEQFLLTSDRGAAAVLGSTSNNYLHSQNYLGQYLTPNLATPGTTIGQALLSAKQRMAAVLPYYIEIHLGWTILGDPTLVMTP